MPGERVTDFRRLMGGLWVGPPAPLPFMPRLDVRSFVLERARGNVAVYGSPGLKRATHGFEPLARPTRLLLNHEHEAMFGAPDPPIPTYVGAADREAVIDSLPIAGTFDGPAMIDDDLEVIPTPGHTPGTTTYRWKNGGRRFLFTGDALWFDGDDWCAAVLTSSDRRAYLASLRALRELEFDVLVPWAAPSDGPPIAVVDRAEAVIRLEAVIDRVAAGSSR